MTRRKLPKHLIGMTWPRGSCTALLLAAAIPAGAQEQPSTELTEVVVTGSRIARQPGATAPTPLTQLDSAYLEQRAVTNVADALNELPAFRGTNSPQQNATAGASAGSNYADLRALGTTRTLVLIDGKRFTPSAVTGQVDLNLLPSILIDRTEVVTGGASASYGSDAVAGVVNFVLKKNVEGLFGDVQYGASEHGDAQDVRAALLGGTSLLDGRFHVTAAAEYEHNGGIGDLYHRAWGRQEWGLIANPTPGNGLPQYLIAPHVVNSTMSATGLITSGPLKGTTFTPSGTPIPFTYGTLAGSTSMIGGSGQSFFSGFSLLPDSNRRLLYLRMNYDVSDHLNVYTDLNFSQYDTHNSGAMPFDFGDLTIRSDNAFLPASIRQAMANGNIASFGFGRFDTDLGLADDNNNNEQGRALLGVQGDFAGNWTYDASVEYGKFHQKFDFINSFQKARFAQAIDVVTNPANGQVVCRSTLTNPGNGCVPFDPFGSGLNSAAGFGYFLGDQYRRLWYDQAAAAANIQGPLLHLPAGELKVAAGAEFRRDTTRVEVDSASLQNLWLYGNSKPLQGSFDVKEVYGEVDIPVLKALPLVNAADITAAVRYTDYSTSGAVRTWKLGGDWSVTDWLRFRATRSLDIRAPNLNELYTPSTRTTVSVTDPLQHSQYFTTVVTSGNTSLKPEEAHNFTAGIVLEPVKNLSFTLDYFDINLTGAVASLAGQDILNRCYSGQSSLCGDIVRDGNGTITAINTSNINLTSLKERGLDLEANYRLDLASLVPLPGALNFRALATKTFNYDANDGTQTLHLAGMIESESRIYPMIPYWIANVNVGYSLDPFTALATVRYISNGKYDNTFVQGVTINDNTVPSRTYVDLSASFKAFGNDKDYLEVYGVINNLFDIAPPMEPDASRGVTNFSYYDVIGRAFKIGVRFKY